VIYFAQDEKGGPIKIGTTQNLDVRSKSLKAIFGVHPRVLAVMGGGVKTERVIHSRFDRFRLRGGEGSRELFEPAPALLSFIAKNGKPWESKPKAARKPRVKAVLFRYAIVATPGYKDWARRFGQFLGKPDVSEVFRDALRYYAKTEKFPLPPKR
jgi:hypothetical protein